MRSENDQHNDQLCFNTRTAHDDRTQNRSYRIGCTRYASASPSNRNRSYFEQDEDVIPHIIRGSRLRSIFDYCLVDTYYIFHFGCPGYFFVFIFSRCVLCTETLLWQLELLFYRVQDVLLRPQSVPGRMTCLGAVGEQSSLP